MPKRLVPETYAQNRPLESPGRQHVIKAHSSPAGALKEDHQEAEANVNHNMHVLPGRIVGLHRLFHIHCLVLIYNKQAHTVLEVRTSHIQQHDSQFHAEIEELVDSPLGFSFMHFLFMLFLFSATRPCTAAIPAASAAVDARLLFNTCHQINCFITRRSAKINQCPITY